MAGITVDIALLLPPALRAAAVETSALLTGRMADHGHPSVFTLGGPLQTDWRADPCEPHVSLFMLRIDESEIDAVVRRAAAVAALAAPVEARGEAYKHNPVGAPELHLAKDDAWTALQTLVVREIEPLRRGRLRPADPAGADLPVLIEELQRQDPRGARVRQLLAYGYDEIDDLFSPHVTFAWPLDETPSPLDDLPPAEDFHGRLDTLAVYGMGSNGTCLTRYAKFRLSGQLSPADGSTAGLAVAEVDG